MSYVYVLVVDDEFVDEAWWTDSTYTVEFKDLTTANFYKIPFAGTKFYMRATMIAPISPMIYDFYGFY
ncbi:hypothetical protein ES703_117041 [subsurface metagenome]